MDNENTSLPSKSNNSNTLPLIVIGVFIVILVFLGIYFFISKTSNENIYLKAIDQMGNYLTQNIKESSSKLNGPLSLDNKINFKLTSKDATVKDIATILNNIEVNLKVDVDYSKKLSNANLNILYNKESLLNLSNYINDKYGFINLDGLYERNIAFDDIDFSPLWSISTSEDFEVLISEFISVVKSNLKSEYFSKANQGNLTDYKLSISKDELVNLKNNIIEEIKNNEVLMSKIMKISGLEKDFLNGYLDGLKESMTTPSADLVIDTYLNNRKVVEKITIRSTSTIELVNNGSNTFTVTVDEEELGTISILNDSFKANLAINDAKIELSTSKNKTNASLEGDGLTFNFNLNNSDEKVDGEFVIDYPSADINFVVSYNMDMKSIESVEIPSLSNAIDYKSISNADLDRIQSNFQNSAAIQKLIGDLVMSGFGNLSLDNLNV